MIHTIHKRTIITGNLVSRPPPGADVAQTAGYRHPNLRRAALWPFRLPLGSKQATNKQIDLWIIGKQKIWAAVCPHVSNPVLSCPAKGFLLEPSIVETILEPSIVLSFAGA